MDLVSILIRVKLFKTNNVISQRFVKFSDVHFSNMPVFFVEKMQEASLIFSTKKFSVFGYKVLKHLMS